MAEETILTGDDLMMGPPSPVVPPELASHVLDGLETCASSLRRLFHCESSSSWRNSLKGRWCGKLSLLCMCSIVIVIKIFSVPC